MRSLIERIEEWLFKQTRLSLFNTFEAEVQFTKAFKEKVEATNCLACDHPLKLRKFERGPKGWEAELICEKCNFHALINTGWTLLENIDSIGRAREK